MLEFIRIFSISEKELVRRCKIPQSGATGADHREGKSVITAATTTTTGTGGSGIRPAGRPLTPGGWHLQTAWQRLPGRQSFPAVPRPLWYGTGFKDKTKFFAENTNRLTAPAGTDQSPQ